MRYLDFIGELHRGTPRNYLERVVGVNKAECARVARQFGYDYWDGERRYGYGGYQYDGRWRPFAKRLADHYGLKAGDSILDVGCGKGYLLHEFTQVVPGVAVTGMDVSKYALAHAHEAVQPFLHLGNAVELPWPDRRFDLVLSINTLHNLHNFQLDQAVREIERVARGDKYVVVDSYRTEEEKVNLLNWQLTCVCFHTPEEWEWFFRRSGYTGDFGCIFYE